jgi:hypothetical protein
MDEKIGQAPIGEQPAKMKWRIGRIVLWVIVVLVLVFIAVQYLNASHYDALVQVIKEDRIGVNPTGAKLDFGDLPHNKDAIRTVDLQSSGHVSSYVIVWTRGDISDFMKVSQNFFTLKPGTKQNLEFTVHVPNSADYRYYRGKVVIFRIPKFW